MATSHGESKINMNRNILYRTLNKTLFQIKTECTIYFKLKFKSIQE